MPTDSELTSVFARKDRDAQRVTERTQGRRLETSSEDPRQISTIIFI